MGDVGVNCGGQRGDLDLSPFVFSQVRLCALGGIRTPNLLIRSSRSQYATPSARTSQITENCGGLELSARSTIPSIHPPNRRSLSKGTPAGRVGRVPGRGTRKAVRTSSELRSLW